MAEYFGRPTGRASFRLGEEPVWHRILSQLSMVNILESEVDLFSFDAECLTWLESFQTEGDVGAALPVGVGGYLLYENQGIYMRQASVRRIEICSLPVKGERYRCNDAKIGPDGRLWVGIMDYDGLEGRGSLWRIFADGECERLLTGLTRPNGPDWCGDECWFVDGPTEEISCRKWDDSGLSEKRNRAKTNGTPDGLAIDSNGDVWLALRGQARVDHFNLIGELVDSVQVQSSCPTSLFYSGQDISTLVVTSALLVDVEQELENFPRAGDVVICDVSALGRNPYLRLDAIARGQAPEGMKV